MRHSPDIRHDEGRQSNPPTELALDPEILHGGTAQVMLPAPSVGCSWRVEWRVIGRHGWHAATCGLGAVHGVPDTKTPEPQHRIEWRAVAERGEPVPRHA